MRRQTMLWFRAGAALALVTVSACTLLTGIGELYVGVDVDSGELRDARGVDGEVVVPPPPADDSGADAEAGEPPPTCFAEPCVVELASGGDHTCVRLVDASVYCWGRNSEGQLGTTAAGGPVPRRVDLPPARALAAGGYGRHDGESCAVVADGVRCWGSDLSRKLGRPEDAGAYNPVPAPVQGIAPAPNAIVVGGEHACVLAADRTALCWGANESGQLGRGVRTGAEPVPAAWVGGAAAQLGAGRNFSCALDAAGEVSCWGIGPGGADASVSGTPTRVAGLSSVVELAAHNGDHACARTTSGAVLCWGRNSFGQLGRGTISAGEVAPAPAILPRPSKHVAVGGEHTCAILDDDSVWCWGRNTFRAEYGTGNINATKLAGQIGLAPDGGNDLLSPVPRKVAGTIAARPRRLSLGYGHTCALLEGGSVACWGTNRDGELGRPSTPLPNPPDGGYQSAPNPVPGLVQFPP